MVLTLQIAQIVIGIFLVVIIIIQNPKAGGMGAIGGMAQMFSSQSSATTWIAKVTTWTAVIFLAISFIIGHGVIR